MLRQGHARGCTAVPQGTQLAEAVLALPLAAQLSQVQSCLHFLSPPLLGASRRVRMDLGAPLIRAVDALAAKLRLTSQAVHMAALQARGALLLSVQHPAAIPATQLLMADSAS